MGDQGPAELVRTPDILELSANNPFFEWAQQINDFIARRAYELFEAGGLVHGHDREDWLRAESEILLPVPVEVTETEDHFTVRAEVAGFTDKDLEVRVTNRALCITGRRSEEWEETQEKTVHAERRASQIFRVLDLPAPVDVNKVNAELTSGVLEITLAKISAGKKIPVLTKGAAA